MVREYRFLPLLLAGLVAAGPSGGACAEGRLGARTPTAPTASAGAAPSASNLTAAVAPESPTAQVWPFYAEGADMVSADRDRFVDPARTVLEKNEALKKSGQGDCLDQTTIFADSAPLEP